MGTAIIATCQRSFNERMAKVCEQSSMRLHWAVLNALGLQPTDILHCSKDLRVFTEIAKRAGNQFSPLGRDASLTIISQISENDLLDRAARLAPGRRLVVYSQEHQIDAMPLRCFDMATACLFDQDSRKVVRIFDGPPRRIREYLHIELAEHDDASLTMQASRIAALR